MLNDVILALAIISAPMVILSISRATGIGWRPIFSFQLIAVSFIWLFWGLRAHISYGWRVGVLLAILATVGLGGYADMGPAAIAGQFLLLFLVVAALFMRAKPAFYSGLAIASLLAMVGMGVVNQKFGSGFDYLSYANDPSTWIVLFLAVAGFGGAIAMMTARLIGEIELHHDQLVSTNDELRLSRDVAESANRMKAEVLVNLGHEFRTPMNGIIGMADLLQLTDDDPDRLAYIGELQASAHRLNQVLDRMLDYVRLGDGRVVLEESPFDLWEVAGRAVASLQEAASAKGLAANFECNPSSAVVAIGDGWRVRQLLGELLDNALRFTRAGGINLRLERIQPSVGDNRLWVELVVSDTGIGVAPEFIESVFDPFVQVDGGVTREVGGNGLGLAICQRIVNLMGGNISFESQLGRGSAVIVRLPFRQ
jgi:signal transduction histidine kinase